jgi:MFS family permease
MATPAAEPMASETLSRELFVLGAVFVLGAIMTVLDLTIVNVAVPTIGRELWASISSIQWVMTGYMLSFASVILWGSQTRPRLLVGVGLVRFRALAVG